MRKPTVSVRIPQWPDLTIDQKALDQAKSELTEDASINEILERAQKIKEEMLRQKRGRRHGPTI
jgi:hypothetical protein